MLGERFNSGFLASSILYAWRVIFVCVWMEETKGDFVWFEKSLEIWRWFLGRVVAGEGTQGIA